MKILLTIALALTISPLWAADTYNKVLTDGVTASTTIISYGAGNVAQSWITGYARGVYAYNKSGASLSSGTVVMNNAWESATIDITTGAITTSAPIGTVYDIAGCAANALCKICTEGLCPARLDTDATCAITQIAVLTGSQVGRALCTDSPDASNTHWRELGQPASYTSTVGGNVIQIWAHRN
jgi:hypothetical protein